MGERRRHWTRVRSSPCRHQTSPTTLSTVPRPLPTPCPLAPQWVAATAVMGGLAVDTVGGWVVPSPKGLVPSLKGLVPSLKGLVLSLKGLVPSLKGLVLSPKGLVPSLKGLVLSLKGLGSSNSSLSSKVLVNEK